MQAPVQPKDEAAASTCQSKADVQSAVFRHDIFNLVVLGVLNTLNFWFLFYGQGFKAFWYATMAYFIADLVWIKLQPHCVKSPRVLVIHHIVAALYTLLPFYYPIVETKMSYVMTVEVNTWLLIAKRVMPSRLLTTLFYVTWFAIRNVFFPYLVWDTYCIYRTIAVQENVLWHPIVLAPIIQAGLCVLNAQWTWTLVRNTRRRSRSQGGGKSHLL